MSAIIVNEPNRWRLETPGHDGWPRSAQPGDTRKYFMISADSHVNEPQSLWRDRIDAKYRDRLPRVITDDNGVQWRVSEGHRPDRLRLSTLEGEDLVRAQAGADPEMRLQDMDRDGIDYPHHEGTWPHSAEAIERTMRSLDDSQRAKVLGGNAARLFKFPVPPGRA